MHLQNYEECLLEEEFLEESLEEYQEGKKKEKRVDDVIKFYLSEATKHNILTREEEIRIGKTIEENEKIILKESLKYLNQIVKFISLLKNLEKTYKFSTYFKDWEIFEKKEELWKIWFNHLKNCLLEMLDEGLKKEDKEDLLEKILSLLYEVRPTKLLLDFLSCDILEIKNNYNEFVRFYQKFLKDYKFSKNWNSLNGDWERQIKNMKKLREGVKEKGIEDKEFYFSFLNLERKAKELGKVLENFEEGMEGVLRSAERILEAQSNIKLAKEQLIKANLRLIISIAKRFPLSGGIFSDLVQEGNLGMLKAVEKFDYRKGFKFSTYATWWIRQYITKYLAENTRTIKIPHHIIEMFYKISNIIYTKFYQKYGREPTLEELSQETGLSVDRLNYIFKIVKEPVSIEVFVAEDSEFTLKEILEDTNILKPDEATTKNALCLKLREILKTLSPREEKIIRLRYGIGEKKVFTLEEVGEKFGVTKERVRQIESQALRKLKHPSRLKFIKNFLYYGS